ncbi:hypothetical protein V6615_02180 [Oscillospiraceae bacterium PP1C4]
MDSVGIAASGIAACWRQESLARCDVHTPYFSNAGKVSKRTRGEIPASPQPPQSCLRQKRRLGLVIN